ncbi:precorrin-3B C17-methyltransferase [Desulfonatronum thiosulfatophilum]|uniref:Precorrin-3B C17-methyltransferase n=2 Tax=Desulfonatronum thiosulfatophilum TaxID=617002 RepID=A0A1G6BCY5_9BACT|nr:precorrin-3B C17-methyltransferase [Desulfonatronum thiosulfatophilum]
MDVAEKSPANVSGPGWLKIVGLGPGSSDLLTPQALQALEQSQAIVGYSVYIDLIPLEILAGKEVLASGMRREIERCNRAVELALEGVNTALVSSGDAGIYGMAGPCLEVLEQLGALDRVECEVISGVPALAAAAGLLGAPLMHDFAVISLSDLLTPWKRIVQRIELASRADFVLVLYNPRSKGRDRQLAQAVDIALRFKSPETPVGLVRNAYRPDQEVSVFPLHQVPVERVDMLSILFIGNSQTRFLGNRMLTPRGYPL